jgi:hypothetical protein
MKSQHIGAVFCGLGVAAIGIAAAGAFNVNYQYCPNPSSVASLCQTLTSPSGTAVARSEALQIGLLLPYLQPRSLQPNGEPEIQLAQNVPSNVDMP